MIFSAIYFSVFIPVSLQRLHLDPSMVGKPYVVAATIDSARIIGLPSSKAAKAYANKIQMPDPSISQITFTLKPVSERQLFFRNYFQNL